MNLFKALPELIKAKVITPETADRIQDYYKTKSNTSTNRLFIVFGILGAILIGLGLLLIIAHNWDELPRSAKAGFAFLPLLVGQILCAFTLNKKQESIAWRESATAFLFFCVGANISLISQIYHLPGNWSTFLLSWMLLCLPTVYIMQSSIVSILYLIGITAYACKTGYGSYPSSESYLYWLLLMPILPHYYFLCKKSLKSNFMTFHNWIIPLSVVISLGTLATKSGKLLFVMYSNLFGLLYLIGNFDFFAQQKSRNNGYKKLGQLGIIVLLFIMSFDSFWENWRKIDAKGMQIISSPEFLTTLILTLLAGGIFYLQHKNKPLSHTKPLAPVFMLSIASFLIGLYSNIAVVLINIYIFAIGILTIRNGAKQNHLGLLNYGLLIITVLIICRFLATDLSFAIRGIMFVAVGIGCFATNYWLIKKRKTNGY